jgi:hypothetical protein
LRELDANLKLVRGISKEHQEKIREERLSETPPEQQNKFQKGDFVLWQRDPTKPRHAKLDSPWVGPYVVIYQKQNDVTCRHMGMGFVTTLEVSRLKLFAGTDEEARNAALLDSDQYVIDKVLAYRGDPMKRSEMEFEVRFQDGDIVWKSYDKDIFETQQLHDYCKRVKQLYPLLFNDDQAKKMINAMKRRAIDIAEPGMKVLVDLRQWGDEVWFQREEVALPDKEHISYVVPCEYIGWRASRNGTSNHKFIIVKCDLFDEILTDWDYYDVYCYGTVTELSEGMQLVDEKLCLDYPCILPDRNRQRLLKEFRTKLDRPPSRAKKK